VTVEREAAAGLKWGSIAKLASQAATWAVTLAVVRLLSPDDYGLMALCMVVITALAGFAEFGLGSSLIQTATLGERDLSRVAGLIFVLNVGAGIVTAVAAPLLSTLLGDERLTPILQMLALQFLFPAIDTVPYSIAYRGMRFKRLASVEFAVSLVGALTTLLLAWLGMGVWALVYGTLISAGLRAVLFVSLGGFVRPSFDFRGVGPHARFGGVVTITRLVWQLTSQADILIAGRLFASHLVGVYSLSMHLATLPISKAMAVINQVAFPTVARLQEETARLRQQLLRSLGLLAVAAIPAMWGLSAVTPEFVDVFLGNRWDEATLPLQLVSFVTPLRMLQAVLATALTGIGRADLELRNTVLGAIVLPVSFFIGARGGLNGLAAAWIVAVPLACALNLPRTMQAFEIKLFELAAAVRAPVVAGVAMYAVVSGIRMLLGETDEALRLPVLIAGGGVCYVVTLRVIDRPLWSDVRKLAIALRG
jgi:O-antigen/teichoic acid export membrane protein